MFSSIKGLWINFLNIFKNQAKSTADQSVDIAKKEAQGKINEVSSMLDKVSSKLDE